MKEYVHEYVEHSGRRCELRGVDIETDTLVGLIVRLSISIGMLTMLLEMVFFIFNLDAGIVDLTGKGVFTIVGIVLTGGAMVALSTFISFILAVPVYKLIYRGRRAQIFGFKIK